MKRQRFFTVIVGLLGLVLVTVGLVGLAQADKPIKPRFSILPKDPDWVLDRSTGLEWQKTPGIGGLLWASATIYCTDQGGDARLPDVKELISLVDYSVASPGSPALPAGFPFVGVLPVFGYWSATTDAGNPTQVWIVGIGTGNVLIIDKLSPILAWCVR